MLRYKIILLSLYTAFAVETTISSTQTTPITASQVTTEAGDNLNFFSQRKLQLILEDGSDIGFYLRINGNKTKLVNRIAKKVSYNNYNKKVHHFYQKDSDDGNIGSSITEPTGNLKKLEMDESMPVYFSSERQLDGFVSVRTKTITITQIDESIHPNTEKIEAQPSETFTSDTIPQQTMENISSKASSVSSIHKTDYTGTDQNASQNQSEYEMTTTHTLQTTSYSEATDISSITYNTYTGSYVVDNAPSNVEVDHEKYSNGKTVNNNQNNISGDAEINNVIQVTELDHSETQPGTKTKTKLENETQTQTEMNLNLDSESGTPTYTTVYTQTGINQIHPFHTDQQTEGKPQTYISLVLSNEQLEQLKNNNPVVIRVVAYGIPTQSNRYIYDDTYIANSSIDSKDNFYEALSTEAPLNKRQYYDHNEEQNHIPAYKTEYLPEDPNQDGLIYFENNEKSLSRDDTNNDRNGFYILETNKTAIGYSESLNRNRMEYNESNKKIISAVMKYKQKYTGLASVTNRNRYSEHVNRPNMFRYSNYHNNNYHNNNYGMGTIGRNREIQYFTRNVPTKTFMNYYSASKPHFSLVTPTPTERSEDGYDFQDYQSTYATKDDRSYYPTDAFMWHPQYLSSDTSSSSSAEIKYGNYYHLYTRITAEKQLYVSPLNKPTNSEENLEKNLKKGEEDEDEEEENAAINNDLDVSNATLNISNAYTHNNSRTNNNTNMYYNYYMVNGNNFTNVDTGTENDNNYGYDHTREDIANRGEGSNSTAKAEPVNAEYYNVNKKTLFEKLSKLLALMFDN
ncbi:hypothetical protein AX774_g5576 [Zancudomyces culisetae]|uniref:Uncharacterized protein n=1 Tax=Zancudomyces culisetae TaxID=1213189 RepID=A0A1R1PJ15_ZANCU|nr:hypothetical protein AX774_g5576 [Zancudomyces culisetae]|eukprot:OMH80974.1 hypothetical protein AX774_g5576 [Zancudomyces culisetae]